MLHDNQKATFTEKMSLDESVITCSTQSSRSHSWRSEVLSQDSDDTSCNSSLQWTFCAGNILDMDENMADGSISEVMSFKNTSALCGDLRYIINMPEMCDVKFLVGPTKEAVYGVKSILATRSRLFYEMLLVHQKKKLKEEAERQRTGLTSKLKSLRRICTPSKTKHQSIAVISSTNHLVIEIDHADVDIFRLVILFLHCGKVDLDITNVVGVMTLSDTYGVEDLRSGCYKLAERLIHIESVLPLLTSTQQYHKHSWTRHLYQQIMAFIAEKAQDVLRQSHFDSLPKRTVLVIFTCEGLRATEEVKWDAALRWTRRNCHQANHFRRNLKMFTSKINLSDIPVQKLTNEVQPLGVVPDHVIKSAIAHQQCPRLVIGQERKSQNTPRKPPRKSVTSSESSRFGRLSSFIRRSPSFNSTTSASSNSDSGISTSTEDCVHL